MTLRCRQEKPTSQQSRKVQSQFKDAKSESAVVLDLEIHFNSETSTNYRSATFTFLIRTPEPSTVEVTRTSKLRVQSPRHHFMMSKIERLDFFIF